MVHVNYHQNFISNIIIFNLCSVVHQIRIIHVLIYLNINVSNFLLSFYSKDLRPPKTKFSILNFKNFFKKYVSLKYVSKDTTKRSKSPASSKCWQRFGEGVEFWYRAIFSTDEQQQQRERIVHGFSTIFIGYQWAEASQRGRAKTGFQRDWKRCSTTGFSRIPVRTNSQSGEGFGSRNY